ncbi:MAG TPA: hypothetical protein VJ787_00295 [Thermoleophilia bacterium]|nr:hypothetical protein [Thermoleophilia bacterium]
MRRRKRYVPENPLVMRAKASVRAKVAAHPRAYWILTPLRRSAMRLRSKITLWLSGTPRDRFLDVERVLWLPPSQIEYQTPLWGSTLRNRGCGWVVAGDWDNPKSKVVNNARYKAVHDVVVDGKSWHETEEYADAVAAIDRGETRWHCRTRKELDERYRLLDRIVESMRRDGYKTQRELRRIRSPEAALGRDDEIAVTIGRHGEVYFWDGLHRLAMAQLLGVPRIPVQVVARHAEWAAFRKELEQYATSNEGMVPQPLLHADLDNIPFRAACSARYRTLLASLPQDTRSVIDITPGWGYFCQRLSGQGFACCAVVHDAGSGRFLDGLRRASSADFAVTTPEALAQVANHAAEFDVGLMLYGGLAPIQTPRAETLATLLALVDVRDLFVEPDAFVHPGTAEQNEAGRGELLGSLRAAGKFTRCDCVTDSHEAGPLFHLA